MEQISKNTVKGTKQLENSTYVTFENREKTGLKIMFVGNSITLHKALPEIGWHNRCGMAASKKNNDYAHICMKEIQKHHSDASFCVCQVCEWESNYKNGAETYHLYENARKYNADIIVMRAIENCERKNFNKDVFKREYAGLIGYLDPLKKSKIGGYHRILEAYR